MNNKANNKKQSPGGIKEVREIIFGDFLSNLQEQINELKAENKDLKANLLKKEKDLEKAFNNIERLKDEIAEAKKEHFALHQEVKNSNSNISNKISSLESTKIDKNQIGQAFIEWGMSVKQQPDS